MRHGGLGCCCCHSTRHGPAGIGPGPVQDSARQQLSSLAPRAVSSVVPASVESTSITSSLDECPDRTIMTMAEGPHLSSSSACSTRFSSRRPSCRGSTRHHTRLLLVPAGRVLRGPFIRKRLRARSKRVSSAGHSRDRPGARDSWTNHGLDQPVGRRKQRQHSSSVVACGGGPYAGLEEEQDPRSLCPTHHPSPDHQLSGNKFTPVCSPDVSPTNYEPRVSGITGVLFPRGITGVVFPRGLTSAVFPRGITGNYERRVSPGNYENTHQQLRSYVY
jgi:hypothetical protein